MKEFIEREAASRESVSVYTKAFGSIEVVPLDAIASIPDADVREVKRGRWEDEWVEAADPHDRRCFRCSSCRTIHAERTNYCPNCGASMENEKKTNYEKIVSMSIENLADLLSNSSCSECPLRYKCDRREEVGAVKCYQYWLYYLKSEAN